MPKPIAAQVGNSAGRIGAWIKKHPGIAAALAVGVVVAAYIAYRNSSGGSPTGTDQTGRPQEAGAGGGLGELQPGSTGSGGGLPGDQLQPIQPTDTVISPMQTGTSDYLRKQQQLKKGGGYTAPSLLDPSLYAPAVTGEVDPYASILAGSYINPTTGQINVFETQPSGNLIEAVGSLPGGLNDPLLVQVNQMFGGAQQMKSPTTQQLQSSVLPAPIPAPQHTQQTGGKPSGLVTTTTGQDVANIQNFFSNIANTIGGFVSNIFGGGPTPNQTTQSGAQLSGGKPSTLPGTTVTQDINNLQQILQQTLGITPPMTPQNTAGVSGTATFPKKEPKPAPQPVVTGGAFEGIESTQNKNKGKKTGYQTKLEAAKGYQGGGGGGGPAKQRK